MLSGVPKLSSAFRLAIVSQRTEMCATLRGSLMPFTLRPYRRFPIQYSVRYHAVSLLTLPLAYFLGFGTLIALLALSSVPANAGWIVMEKDSLVPGLRTVYTDPNTIQREGNLVTMWQLMDFKWMQGGQSPTRFMSTETTKQFDCAVPRLRLLAFSVFSYRMGAGIRNEGLVDKDNWLSIEPGSINQDLWEVACNTK